MHERILLSLFMAFVLTSCVDNADLEDYEKYAAKNPYIPAQNSIAESHSASIKICPYLSLGTADTVSYKDYVKVCIEEIVLRITTDGKEKVCLLSTQKRYADTENITSWADIPAGVTHVPDEVQTDTSHYAYTWGCEAVAEIVYKVRMREDNAMDWTEWESSLRSKICCPDTGTYHLRILLPIKMGAISFDAVQSENTSSYEIE